MKISDGIFRKFGGTFHDTEELPPGWINECGKEKQRICDIVRKGKIELIKDNRLIMLADLYDEIFSDAKWIFINRRPEELFRSQSSAGESFESWRRHSQCQLNAWKESQPSNKSLNISYEDFGSNFDDTLGRIAKFLDVQMSDHMWCKCREFYRPKARSRAQVSKFANWYSTLRSRIIYKIS